MLKLSRYSIIALCRASCPSLWLLAARHGSLHFSTVSTPKYSSTAMKQRHISPVPRIPATARQPLDILKQFWGYNEFRSCQERVISSVLRGQDNLVVMATGGGKSMCYQLPALVHGKVCIVISPLISLMEDQVAALQDRGISAALLGSAQSDYMVKADAWAGRCQFVYMTPELALADSTREKLTNLHRSTGSGIGLIAVDEAHCVSEWGQDFRPQYLQLGVFKDRVDEWVGMGLSKVPIMALTATATESVQAEIMKALRLDETAQVSIESFERTNLVVNVLPMPMPSNKSFKLAFAKLVQERQSTGKLKPTLIYTNTKNKVDEIVAWINESLPVKDGCVAVAGAYHASLDNQQRRNAHKAFLRDDHEIMVATMAYGMGIDKPNIRDLYHFGTPATLESYYQQAGRAGRDGLKSTCTMFWGHGDIAIQDTIKKPMSMTDAGKTSYQAGITTMQAYCTSTHCRHALMVNHFDPGRLPLNPEKGCEGGCDNCARHLADGAWTKQDFSEQALLLLSALVRTNGKYGSTKIISLLRGAKASSLPEHFLRMREHSATELSEATEPASKDTHLGGSSGRLLHGSSMESKDYWKDLEGLLLNEGFLEYKAHTSPGISQAWGRIMPESNNSQEQYGRSYSALSITPAGLTYLASRGSLVRPVPVSMQDAASSSRVAKAAGNLASRGTTGARKRSAKAVEAARLLAMSQAAANEAVAHAAAAAAAKEAARDDPVAEMEDLKRRLTAERKLVADALDIRSDVLVSDVTLEILANLRPTSHAQMRLVSGMSEAALSAFQGPLLSVIANFMLNAKHAKASTNWGQLEVQSRLTTTSATSSTPRAFSPQSPRPSPQSTRPPTVILQSVAYSKVVQAPAQVPITPLPSTTHVQAPPAWSHVKSVAPTVVSPSAPKQDAAHLRMLFQLKAPGRTAKESLTLWQAGASIEAVATNRASPIQRSTVLSHLSDCAASDMLQPAEIQRLVKEAGVNAEMAKAVTNVCAVDRRGIIHIQAALPALEFGQIKVVAMLMARKDMWFLETPEEVSSAN